MLNVLLSGIGGQGTVLAAKLLAQAAQSKGWQVRTAETIGMAQRGGCVTSHVRVGACDSPLIPKGTADAIIAFEPAEAVRALDYLKKDGVVVVNTAAVKPVTDTLADSGYTAQTMLDYLRRLPVRVLPVDAEGIARKCGSPKVVNIALLGAAAAAGCVGTEPEEIEEVISTLAPRFREANLTALKLGMEAAKEEERV